MAKLSDISEMLEKSIENVSIKKKILDDANASAARASAEYQASINKAQEHRALFMAELGQYLPEVKPKIG